MYFFVGRPQAWDSFLEVYSVDGGSFTAGNEVYVGANYGAATFKGTIVKVLPSSLLISSVGPQPTSSPALGSGLTEYDGAADTGVTATTGVYRYSTENIPPAPLDNLTEKYSVYSDIIAAKRITSSFARSVIRRYNWDTANNPKFDMWKPNYSADAPGGGAIGVNTALGGDSISTAKFYVMNQQYEVFKCLYNGESIANPSGVNVVHEPKTNPSAGLGSYANGIFTAPDGSYVWKYMYTMPTDDVLAFLSSDFMPIAAAGEASRVATETAAVAGSLDIALIKDGGTGLTNGTFYAPVLGDGTGAIAKLVVTAGAIESIEMESRGSGYTYASIPVVTGVPLGTAGSTEAIGLFSDVALTTSQAVAATSNPALEVILPPQGGHGSDFETELNAKRVMTNIRLTFVESAGDFPVDNDFRRIGIIKDPYEYGTTTFATADTLSGLKSVKITGATGDYTPDEMISQTVTGGTAKGTVVSWTLDAGSPTPTPSTPGSGVLKYMQSPAYHRDDNEIVRDFASDASNAVVGADSATQGTVEVALADGTELVGATFTDGLADPEIAANSGDLIYIENRRLITRAADQIEDIKLVIEF